jgi:VWFA-related protein
MAQVPAVQGSPQAPAGVPQPATSFRVTADLISTDVTPRDTKGQFMPDLTEKDFEVLEDGIKQQIVSFALVHGGRTYNQLSAPVAALQEGLLIPRNRPTVDASGRVFILFIDDLHLDFRVTPKVRELLKKISKNLIHDGDMFGIVTTGTSVITQQLTYDKQILDSVISRITGNALKLQEIKESAWSSQGPTEVRHRAHVAFETLHDLLKNLESVQNRRKAIIYISCGYDFNPMERTRFEEMAEKLNMTADQLRLDPFVIEQQSNNAFNEADLVHELAYVTRMANRANATIYTIDPRGLIAGQDMDDNINPQDSPGACRGNQGAGDRQPERLRQGAENDRRADQRLLPDRVLFQQPRSAQAQPPSRRESGWATQRERDAPRRVRPEAAAALTRAGLNSARAARSRVSRASAAGRPPRGPAAPSRRCAALR